MMHPRLSRQSGFTLVEILVAATVTMILVGILLGAAQNIMNSYKSTQGAITRQGDITFAVSQLIQDLEGLVIPNTLGAEGLHVTPENIGPNTASVSSQWLTFLSTVTDVDTSTVTFTGATRAISYRLAYQNPIDGTQNGTLIYAFYRSVAPAQHTFNNAVGQTDLQTNYWTVYATSSSSTPVAPTDISNFVSENVVQFQVRFLYKNPVTSAYVWTQPGDNIRIGQDGYTVTSSSPSGYSGKVDAFTRKEVSMTVLSPEGARRLRDGVITLDTAILKYGRTAVKQAAF